MVKTQILNVIEVRFGQELVRLGSNQIISSNQMSEYSSWFNNLYYDFNAQAKSYL